jgi:uncharacterized protein (DUF983 family)
MHFYVFPIGEGGSSMAIIHIAAVSAALKKKINRNCPQCGKTQAILKEYVRDSVLCSRCGTIMPPPAEGPDAR